MTRKTKMTDYARHLEEISKETERLLLEVVQILLISNKIHQATKLLREWEKYSQFLRKVTLNQTMTEEMNFFLQKLEKLNDIWKSLHTNEAISKIQSRITSLSEKGRTLTEAVTREGTLNAGGKFEWVDSILIKCLQNGSWLLVDNVNLCSPAVLDRLNALFEPNGVLIVGERGVDKNGHMVTIKPHKDFRLFMTMDPKNGEISRAMRNRGVEIYILNDTECRTTNQYDIKSLSNQKGLLNSQHIEMLLKIHDFISDLIMGEKPNINHILHSSFLISQKLLRGMNVYEAFYTSVFDVYYKTRSSYDFKTTNIMEAIKLEIYTILNSSSVKCDSYDYDVTLKCADLQSNSELYKIKQQMVMLNKYGEIDKNMIIYFIMHFYSVTSMKDISMRLMYVQNYFSNSKRYITEINKIYTQVLTNIHCDTINLPIDKRWLIDGFYKNSNISQSNRLLLTLYFLAYKTFNEVPVDKITINVKKELTLLQYLYGVSARKIEKKIDDVVVTELLDLLNEFDKFFISLFGNEVLEVSNEQTIQVMSVLQWRFILYQILNVNISNIKSSHYNQILSNLHVHYKWFIKFSVYCLKNMFNIQDDMKLTLIVNNINSNLNTQFNTFNKIGKHYQKCIERPPPLINVTQIEITNEYHKMTDYFDLYKKGNKLQNVLHILNSEKELLPLLIDLKFELDYEYSTTTEKYVHLKKIYYEYTHTEAEDKCKQHDINVLPVADYFALLSIYKFRYTTISDNIINVVTVPLNLQTVLKSFITTRDGRLLDEVKNEILHYITNCASLLPSNFLNFGRGMDKERDIIITLHTPILSYLYTELLVDNDNKNVITPTEFGSYRDVTDKNRKLSFILWRNMQQLSNPTYDYLYCEVQYLKSTFTKFLKDFAKSLNVEEITNESDLVETCIKEIDKYYAKSQIKDIHNDKEVLVTLLKNCKNSASLLKENMSLTYKINCISSLYISMNYLKSLLNSKLPIIDRFTKVALKKKYCLKEKNNFECLKLSYQLQNEVYSNSDKTLSPLYNILTKKINVLHEKDLQLGQYVAVRPESIKYETVLKEVNHGFTTVLSAKKMLDFYNNLNESIDLIQNNLSTNMHINIESSYTSLKFSRSTISSVQSFVNILTLYRYLYPDIIEPLLCNVMELLYGIKLKISLLKKLVLQYENMRKGINLHQHLIQFIKFPVLDENYSDYIEVINLYNMDAFKEQIVGCLTDETNPNLGHQQKFSLLKCSIHEIYNSCITDAKYSPVLDQQLFNQFNNFIQLFVSAWNKQEEERELNVKESESLYKIKTKCIEKSEEELIEDEFLKLFPSYHEKDFSDMQQAKLNSDDDKETNSLENDFVGLITVEDIKFVSHLHSTFVNIYTKSEWLDTLKQNIPCDYVTPLLQKLKLFKLLVSKYIDGLNYTLDNNILSSLHVLTYVAQHFGNIKFEEINSPSRTTKKHYNFYNDPAVEEIKSSYHILEELRLRIKELLNDWPDHPTLQTINTVILRIFAFDITSPVTRFLTGFEILLTKCNEWEENAHSGVSLQQYTTNLIQQIVVWRKMELNMWKDSLNNTFNRLNEPISKWWIYFYNMLNQFIKEEIFTIAELISTLKKFITESNLAEFENRLALVYTFHCHCIHLERTKKSEALMNVLWNLYHYHKQFLPNVSAKIKELRSPIEKKLKDYVKIVRWKDISYWAIKETLEKTHKTIHKYMREYEHVLKQPVRPYLINTTSQKQDCENIGIWDRPQRVSPKTYHYTLDPVTYMAKRTLSKKLIATEDTKSTEGLLAKAEKYFSKSRTLCRDTVSSAQYPILIQRLDGFVTEVIDTSAHLQSLEVDTTLSKDKQKSQGKNILQQKHRALADLFKTLSTIGLSFKTGIIEDKIKDSTSEYLFKPINLNAAFGLWNYRPNDEKLLTIWDGCEMYYNKSLLRLNILNAALENPAKDLGLQNVERCKGFATNLMNLCQEQKLELIKSTRTLYYLRYYNTYLLEFCEESSFLHSDYHTYFKNVMKNLVVVMDQYKIILNTCPDEVTLGTELNDIPVLKTDNSKIFNYKNDIIWDKTSSYVNSTVNSSEKILTWLHKSKIIIPCTEADVVSPKYIAISDKESLGKELNNIDIKLNELLLIFGDIPFSNSLKWLIKEINTLKGYLNEKATHQVDNTINITVESFKSDTEKLIEKLLVAIQAAYVKYNKTEKGNVESTEINPEQDTVDLIDQHLKVSIISNLFEDIARLNMRPLLKQLVKIANQINELDPDKSINFKNLISHSLPVLEQIILLYQYFITQQVSAYRVSCKLNSILLNIFLDLATKGFCIPPELSEEIDSEGQSQSSGGMGLGDGEGEKDVSDRIESEDQLEGAEVAGQEKEADKDKDCKEEDKGIEMSEDFDSQLQDKKKTSENEDESNSDSDADEQMGETEKGADLLDQQIWGSDEETEENNDDGKEQAEDKGGKGEQEGEQELSAKEKESKGSEEQEDESNKKSEENNKKDINEMEEPEYDDEQIDPYHGNQPEQPEPEPMDIPDDIQLDGNENEGEENEEENPYDIDTLKEERPPEEKNESHNLDDKQNANEDAEGENEDKQSEDESDTFDEEQNTDIKEQMEADNIDESENNHDMDKEHEKPDDKIENSEQSALDQTQTHEDEVQAMHIDTTESADNVQENDMKNQKSLQQNEEVSQEDNPDKEGVGQSQMEESKTGHKGQANAQQDSQSAKENDKQEEKRQRPGESNTERSLGDVMEPAKKKLKTVNIPNEDESQDLKEDQPDEKKISEMYQHIKDAKSSTEQVLDTATKEQVEQQKELPNIDEEDTEKPTESSENVPENNEDDINLTESVKHKAELLESEKKVGDKGKHPEGDVLEEMGDIEIEGDVIQTATARRGDESAHYTQYNIFSENKAHRLSVEELNQLRAEVEQQLSVWNEPPSSRDAEQTWEKISSVTASLAQDLSEQLRLVLEPTQSSRLKGDFRTGKRINMRKVIPYIASQFRKDKIWLRRTKPSKREYQIVLAIDDSSSMSDNHSKELAFESVAVISKALALLESGQLSVLSFGETTEILHKLTDTFTEKSGSKLLQSFQFNQQKTCVAKLVDFATEMLNSAYSNTNALNAKLLIIVSDGRGIFSEGESYVQQAVRRAKLSNIFMVFVIIDNPENTNSILDIRMPIFGSDNKLVEIKSYMDSFPFPFYLILRDINSLPNVLSDALRQWFEMVSNIDKV